MYEPGASLGERVWALAEIVRRRFEEAGHVVSGQDPALPEKAKQVADEYERKETSLIGSGMKLGEIGGIGHGNHSLIKLH